MKITRTCLIKEQSLQALEELDELMAVFCSSERFSFNRLLEGAEKGELIKKVMQLFRLNKRYAEDAVLQAQAVLSSQQALLPMRIEGVQSKIRQTRMKMEAYQTGKKKPKKVPLEVCLSGLQARLDQLTEKEAALLKHQEEGTIPKVIFGGRKQFYARLKNKITNQEWQALRSNTLYARGDKSKKGNLNTRIVFDEPHHQAYLEVANPLKATGKHSPRIRLKLHIPEKYFDEIVDVVMPTVVGYNAKGNPNETYQVYSIEIKRKSNRYYVHMTYDIDTCGRELKWSEPITSAIVAGIDVNIDRVAVSIVTKQGNLLESKTFYCHEMEYVKSQRRSHIAGELAKEVVEYLLQWNVGAIVLEDITLKQDHDTNKQFNRLTHAFAKTKLQQAIIARGLKDGFTIKQVNPAYTSVIGRFKYSKQYGLSVHEAASFVIGRRGLGLDEKMPKSLLHTLRSLVKPHLIGFLGSMEESEKNTASGKQQRKYVGMLINTINTFKEHHTWKVWNVVHKTISIQNQAIQLKEVNSWY